MAKEAISSWLPPRGWAMHKAVREEGLLLRTRRRRGRRSCMGRAGESSPDLPARDFGAEDPMAKPAADVAEFRVGGAKPRLSPVVDPCSDEVAAYSISGSPNMKTAPGCRRASRAGSMAETPRCRIRTWAGSTGCARLQARARADGDRPVHVPQRKPPRQREGRELPLDGQDRALLRSGGRPRCLREGSGEAYRPV